jgi:EXLDI family protein
MPNRTIYVADSDLPTFEKAQQLAGDNLSATIVQALRRFVEAEEARASGYHEITVAVGKGRPYVRKQFRGRSLAKRRLSMNKSARVLTLEVYQTAQGRFVLYSRNSQNWDWSDQTQPQQQDEPMIGGKWQWKWGSVWDWSGGSGWTAELASEERRIDIFENLETLKDAIPEEMYESVMHYLHHGDDVEFLDI